MQRNWWWNLLPGPVLHGLNLIPAWISNYIIHKMWNEIIYPLHPLKFGNANFTPHFTGYVIMYPLLGLKLNHVSNRASGWLPNVLRRASCFVKNIHRKVPKFINPNTVNEFTFVLKKRSSINSAHGFQSSFTISLKKRSKCDQWLMRQKNATFVVMEKNEMMNNLTCSWFYSDIWCTSPFIRIQKYTIPLLGPSKSPGVPLFHLYLKNVIKYAAILIIGLHLLRKLIFRVIIPPRLGTVILHLSHDPISAIWLAEVRTIW